MAWMHGSRACIPKVLPLEDVSGDLTSGPLIKSTSINPGGKRGEWLHFAASPHVCEWPLGRGSVVLRHSDICDRVFFLSRDLYFSVGSLKKNAPGDKAGVK